MLDLTGEHIQKLGDDDLRELVVRLCSAELRRLALPESSVTAGGNQNAADGGVDVRVELGAAPAAQLDFIRSASTGFQVKAQDMAPADIRSEMKPDGSLRPVIRSLATNGGAYVIVSSKGSVADSALQRRLRAMRDAAADEQGAAGLVVDFYDRTRLATWVRRYPGVEMWVRERADDRLKGWQGYGAWSGTLAGSSYVHDSAGTVLSKTSGTSEPMSAVDGIDAIRNKLRSPGSAVRLIGLSGTGKTRLVQALFEAEVGATLPLDKAVVLYTDLGHSPEPSARDMLLRVGSGQQRAIVVVDNCNPATHRALAEAVGLVAEYVSLLTVEYDVSDDEPEATDVFELAPASDSVLEKILAQRAPHISQTDRGVIAEFAGGNARIALALARTVQHGETLGILNDADLFRRLFNQNQGDDQGLLRAAEACSLVYSFDGEDLESADSELRVLAELASCTVREMYRHVSKLIQRDLVQRRGRWRAVLPHALANRLAKAALSNLPRSDLIDAVRPRERLLRSFSRRLGYLHDSVEACAIAERWMEDEEWLANPARLNELGQALFFNLAPLVPDKVLGAFERAVAGEHGQEFTSSRQYSVNRWLTLSRSLAYEVQHFERAARVVLRFAEAEEGRQTNARNAWKELFHVVLSGTLAPPGQRTALLRELLDEDAPRRREFAADAVAAMLKSSHFSASHDFSFGARSRGFGWEPHTRDDYLAWYEPVFLLMQDLVRRGGKLQQSARSVMAQELRSLWHVDLLRPRVDALVRELARDDGWAEGWVAVRSALRFDGARMPAEAREHLMALESLLAPKSLQQEIRSYVIGRAFGALDVADGEDADDATEDANPVTSWERAIRKATSLGEIASADDVLLSSVAEELLSSPDGRQHGFGVGLGQTTTEPIKHWTLLYETFAALSAEDRNPSLLAGFLHGLRVTRPAVAGELLEQLVTDQLLGDLFPYLQGGAWDDASGDRLIRALEHGRVPANRYFCSIEGEGCDGLKVESYCKIIRRLAEVPGGVVAAIDLVTMEFHRFKSRKRELTDALVLLGRDLLDRFTFDISGHNLGYRLKELANVSYLGETAKPSVRAFLERFAAALEDYRTHADSYSELAGLLFKLQPETALDVFLSRPRRRRMFPFRTRFDDGSGSIVECAPAESILQWVQAEPGTRLPLVAAEIEILDKAQQDEPCFSPLADKLLAMASDPRAVLVAFAHHFAPTMWSGSIEQTLRPYLSLATRLSASSDAVVAEWAARHVEAMRKRIEADQRVERHADERFE